MAEELIVHGAEEIVSRIVSLAFDEIGLLVCVKREVRNLQATFTSIQAVLHDAEQKQVKDRILKVWLNQLKEVAYDAEDVLDDIAYEKLRRSIIDNNKAYCTFFSSFIAKPWLHLKIGHRIRDINLRLADIDNRKNMFNLDPASSSSNSVSNHRETTSFVDVSTVIGRESDKEKIVAMLLNHGSTSSTNTTTTYNDFQSVAITGLGGIGKTILAQLAYNADAVKKHFDLRIWICVSNIDFDSTNLFAQILEQIPGSCRPESASKQVLQNNLEKGLKEKKFLLVLDDVWNEKQEDWDDFALPLKSFGANGSRVMVTSRSLKVASMVRAQDPCGLKGLSDDSCWALIEKQAFIDGGLEKTPNLVEIGKEISKKCKGVPLAAKFLGGLLSSKKGEREWLAVQNAEFWNMTFDKEENYLMEVLKLSFNNLSPTLKSCFSYCAIFPKGYRVSKELLIQLWMAQGFLETSGTRGESTMEENGNTYFNILYSKSFFQEAEVNNFGEVVCCKMHDLVQDLAQSICESECQIIGDNTKTSLDLSKCLHASLISSKPLEGLKEAKKLRTLFSLESDPFQFTYPGKLVASGASTFFDFALLRVLDLSHCECSKFASCSHGKLKHLRYLDLSYTSIDSLPMWVTRLYNLQTLKLTKCLKLTELPEDLKNLKNLRHLFVDEYQKWKKMPQAIGELVELQTLPIFVACEEDNGRGISVLKNLNNLQGTLDIHRLCLVKEGNLANISNLIGKSNLQNLRLHWDRIPSVGGDNNDLHVLEELQPHTNLQQLSLEGFGGVEFPQWVSSGSNLPCLKGLDLDNCNNCEYIPSFSQLPGLESIKMKHMSSVKCIIGVRGASQSSYPLLKKLELRNLPLLEEWSRSVVVLFPSLTWLVLDDVGGIGVVSITSSLTSLTSLSIKNCRDLEFLPKGLLRNNSKLNDVRIEQCPKLQALQEGLTDEIDFVGKNSLREMTIHGCDALKFIPDTRGFTSLQILKISKCPKLETIRKGFLSSLDSLEDLRIFECDILEDTIELSHGFKHLRELQVSWCPNFKGFGHKLTIEQELVLLPCISTLKIWQCPAMTSINLRRFFSLRILEITSCRRLEVFRGLQFLTALHRLEIGRFSEELDCFPSLGDVDDEGIKSNNPLLPSLRMLEIYGWPALKSLPHHIQRLTTLKSLSVNYFTNLRELPEWLGNLACLEILEIYDCEILRHLPSKEQMQQLTILKELHIGRCPHLEERCKRIDRDGPDSEWPKISNIPEVWIDFIRQ